MRNLAEEKKNGKNGKDKMPEIIMHICMLYSV